MDIDGYVACICEGSAEQAIMEKLLEEEALIFSRDKLIDDKIIRCRNAKTFEKRHLRKGYDGSITVIRVLDSRRENFELSKAYAGKVEVINIVTAPEIEILIIIKENRYEEFKKMKKKPSEFCKGELCLKNVKNYNFIQEYFSNVDDLKKCIREYTRLTKRRTGEYTLSDLLK
jgi:hypothetical protein